MLRQLKKRTEPPDRSLPTSQLSVATLLAEIARADFEVEASERTAIRRLLGAAYGLDPAAAGALADQAEHAVEEAVSLYEFTRRLNDELSPEEKVEIIEMLWRVAFADGHLDKYEEHLVRKAADLLHVPHRRFIRAKLRAGQVSSPPPAEPTSR